jgi:SET domain-containing protein
MKMRYIFLIVLLFCFKAESVKTEEQETKQDQTVEIKESQIPGAGMGLYAKKIILKDAMVTDYKGKKVTREEYNQIHAKKEHWYMFTMPECANEPNFPYLDGDRNHFASKVNFAPSEINGKQTNLQNVYFLKHCEEPYIRLYASRDIKKGEELYVSYGGIYDYHFMQFKEVQEFFIKKSGIKLGPKEKFTFKD